MNKKENRKIQRIFLTEKIYYEENVESKKISNKKNRYEIFIINIECSLLLRSHIFVTWMDSFPTFILANIRQILFRHRSTCTHTFIISCSPNVASKIEEVSQYRWILATKIIEKCNGIQDNPAYRPSHCTRRQNIYGKVFFFVFYISRKSSYILLFGV